MACCLTADAASETERSLIAEHRSNKEGFGYNITCGGYHGFTTAPSTRRILSAQRIGNTRARACAVNQFTEDGKLVATFRSVKQASERTGVHRTHINRTINHRPTDTAGGFRWAKA